ncbi:cytochrome P450 [Gloeopeniophorella convolvens]|nr:cytochrome P450 [Gloeopeniophorella convolvens]
MPSFALVFDFFALLLCLVVVQAIRDRRRRQGLPYPPGPSPLPLIGNMLDIPKKFSWLTYAEMGKKYGDVLSLRAFGHMVVVLNSAKAAKELLEKRGAIYSDRPVIPFYDMMEMDLNLPVTRYGEDWRLARRLVDRGLRAGAVVKYRPMQQTRTRVLLSRVLEQPDNFEEHVETMQGELILAMTYGYKVKGRADERLVLAKLLNDIGATRLLPGGLLVNELPFLRHIPEWLPWISYKPLAREGRELWQEAAKSPIRFVRESTVKGTAQPSLAFENLQEAEKLSDSERQRAEHVLTFALASMYTAGADTTGIAIKNFLLAALLHPNVQRRAQAELDVVTGRQRLPTFEDRPLLPYTDAICREVLRWKAVTPLAVPHASTQDDIYEGFFIPKGAVIVANTWAILRDPSVYPEPDEFKPERFLNSDGTVRDDPMQSVVFGYGKRICPGRHFVDGTLFITVASLLSVFNIERKKDQKGEDIAFEPKHTDGILSHPAPFPYIIAPRDKRAHELVTAEALAR